jgi:hypothetical protein
MLFFYLRVMLRLLNRSLRIWGIPLLFGFAVAAEPAAPSPRQSAIAAMYPVMIKAVESGNFGQARNICDQAILWEPSNPVHHYNLACIEARAGGARLPFALPALARAAELGFTEIGTLRNDPDLNAVRSDPRFAGIERIVARNSDLQRPSDAAASPPPPAGSGAAIPASQRGLENLALLANVDPPAPARFDSGAPVGLYFMTRFWAYTGSLEKAVWYFAPDGTVYQHLETGFSPADLELHPGQRGRCIYEGDTCEVTWSDGKRSRGRIERSASGFSWNAGSFTPVRPFDPARPLAGIYEGSETVSSRGSRAAVASTLELRPDGTYTWSGVSFLSATSDASRVIAGANGTDSQGRWHAGTLSIVLVDARGHVYRRIAFPLDDEKTPVNPDRIFFGGTLFQRR